MSIWFMFITIAVPQWTDCPVQHIKALIELPTSTCTTDLGRFIYHFVSAERCRQWMPCKCQKEGQAWVWACINSWSHGRKMISWCPNLLLENASSSPFSHFHDEVIRVAIRGDKCHSLKIHLLPCFWSISEWSFQIFCFRGHSQRA